MRVLVIGQGAREHAIAWAFSRSKRISGLFAAPGNAGMREVAEVLTDIDPMQPEQVIGACRKHGIDLVFVGPEGPLDAGLVDAVRQAGIAVIGPHRAAARLESSKVFSKEFMRKHRIPTARSSEFTEAGPFERYIASQSGKVVLKKNGLAAGKGVLESDDREELLRFGREVLAGDSLVVEEFLTGFEVSLFALCDGKDYVLLPTCADFKKAGEGDTGPNTGGMGSVCPVPWVDSAMMKRIQEEIVVPTFSGLKDEGLLYCGVLYFGLMMTADGPRVLEYNVRFGDPEAQVLLPIIESDFGNLCDAMVSGTLGSFPLRISNRSALGVVIAAEGYPGEYRTGLPVSPIPSIPDQNVQVFHAVTRTGENGTVLTEGGRCFTVVGTGHDLLEANVKAYEAVGKVRFPGAWFRTDIGHKFFQD